MLRAWLEVPALGELARLAQLVGLVRLKKLFSTTRCTVYFYCKKRLKTLVFVTSLSPRRIDTEVNSPGNRSLTKSDKSSATKQKEKELLVFLQG